MVSCPAQFELLSAPLSYRVEINTQNKSSAIKTFSKTSPCDELYPPSAKGSQSKLGGNNKLPKAKMILDHKSETSKAKSKDDDKTLVFVTEGVEYIYKKRKLEDNNSDASTSRSDGLETILTANSQSIFRESPEGSVVEIKEKSGGLAQNKKSKAQKVAEITYNYREEKVLFKVIDEPDKNENELRSLTKEELIKENPLLLLYFYESNLKFNKTKDFKPESLKKIHH